MKLILALILAFSAQALALDSEDYEVYFTQPQLDGTTDLVITENLVRLTNAAVPGSDIHVSIYHIYLPIVSQALLRANQRGVNIYVVADGSSRKRPGYQILRYGDGKLPAIPRDNLHLCRGDGCISSTKNHSKFYLFSELADGTRNVVANSSANLTKGQYRHFNDLLILKNNQELYQRFLQYWNFQFNEQKSAFKKSRKIYSVANGITAYFFPMKKKNDPIVRLLSRVQCGEGAFIRVAQSRFTRSAVAKSLKSLAKQGCDVKVIARDDRDKSSPSAKVRKVLKQLMRIIPYFGGYDSIHTKIVLIKAIDKGTQQPIHWVSAGSHNLNGNSLSRNGEAQVVVDSEALFADYLQFWGKIDQALEDYKDKGITVPL